MPKMPTTNVDLNEVAEKARRAKKELTAGLEMLSGLEQVGPREGYLLGALRITTATLDTVIRMIESSAGKSRRRAELPAPEDGNRVTQS